MSERFVAEKSAKAEKFYLTLALIAGIVHISIFIFAAVNLFMPGFNRKLGLQVGLMGGIAALVLFVGLYFMYVNRRNLPAVLIEEKEEGFSLLNGKEFCRFEYVEKAEAKPAKLKDADNSGTVILTFPSGEIFKIKSVKNAVKTAEEMNRILAEKKTA